MQNDLYTTGEIHVLLFINISKDGSWTLRELYFLEGIIDRCGRLELKELLGTSFAYKRETEIQILEDQKASIRILGEKRQD